MPVARDALLHPQYYVLFGRLHVQKAIFIILVLKTIVEILEFLLSIAVATSFDSVLEVLDECLGLVELIALFLAYRHKNHHFLIPAILYQVFRTVIMFLAYTLTVAVMVLPTSHLSELFGRFQNFKVEMFIMIVTGYMASWYAFCLLAYLGCYKYYEDRHTLPARNPTIVGMNTNQIAEQRPSTSEAALSFRNPNYNETAETEPFTHDHGEREMV